MIGADGAGREGYVSPEEVALARDRCRPGDAVVVRTYKSSLDDSLYVTGADRLGVVVGKYPHFAVVWLPGGVTDSVTWVELALAARRDGR